MSVYFIAQVEIHDAEGYAAYMAAAGPTLADGSVKILALDEQPEVIEGEWFGPKTIVMEFDSEESFRKWYDSPAYQEAAKLRATATTARSALVKALG